MNVFLTHEVASRASISQSALWRRLARLEREGILQRRYRMGGPGGGTSSIFYEGTLEELVARIQTVPEREAAGCCPTCGAPNYRVFAPGPACPRCGKATTQRNTTLVWCESCREGFFTKATGRQRPAILSSTTEGAGIPLDPPEASR